MFYIYVYMQFLFGILKALQMFVWNVVEMVSYNLFQQLTHLLIQKGDSFEE